MASILEYKPTPDTDLVEARWEATNLDGSAQTGKVTLTYQGPRAVRDKNPAHRVVSFRSKPIVIPIAPANRDWNGAGEMKSVGYGSRLIPALSTDPDIEGGGGTYLCRVEVDGEAGFEFPISADHTVPGGVIHLAQLAAAGSTNASGGSPIVPITAAQMETIDARLAAVESQSGSGGGSTSIAAATDYPAAVQSVVKSSITGAGVGYNSLTKQVVINQTTDQVAVRQVLASSLTGDALVQVVPNLAAGIISLNTTGITTALGGKVDSSDSRLTDSRPPKLHASTHTAGGSDPITVNASQLVGTISPARLGTGAAGTGAKILADNYTWIDASAGTTSDPNAVKLTGDQTIAGSKTFSSAPSVPDGSFTIAKTSSLQAELNSRVSTSDSRLTDARTPKTHASTHTAGGSDPITVTGEQISGTIPADRLGAGTADQTTVLWGDRTWRPPPAASTMQYNPTQAQIDAMPVGTYYVTSP